MEVVVMIGGDVEIGGDDMSEVGQKDGLID